MLGLGSVGKVWLKLDFQKRLKPLGPLAVSKNSTSSRFVLIGDRFLDPSCPELPRMHP